jgi:hypothetical protein
MIRYAAMTLAFCAGAAAAQVPAVLLEACNSLEPAAKRLECLRAANRNAHPGSSEMAAQPVYRAPAHSAPANSYNFAPSPAARYSAPSGTTCFTGPRGGTYTITKSGKKNYGGC